MSASALINEQVRRLQSDFGLTPVVACEIEFVLNGSDSGKSLEGFWQRIKEQCAAATIPIFKIEKERGQGQYEVALMPVEAEKAAAGAIALIQIITDTAPSYDMRADFSAKPFPDQPGNGLHVHIHLQNADGKNLYTKDDSHISDALKFSIGGLLVNMPESMLIFAPHLESRKRFVPGSNAPLTISWGANNRTVAIRLPDSASSNKHIEHRVPGADADPQAVIAVILEAIYLGLQKKIEPGPQIYGDASLPMYGLPKLVP